MKLKKLLTISLIASLAIPGVFALDDTTTSTTKTSNYVVNAKAEAIPYSFNWYPSGSDNALVEGAAIQTDDGENFNLLDTSTQRSGNIVLKTSGDGNLNSALTMEISILPTSFYEVDADGNKINGGFDTASSTTEFGYNFSLENNKIYPVIKMTPYKKGSAQSSTYGVSYQTAYESYNTYGKKETLIIGAGYHPSGLNLSRFNLSVTGNENVKAGTYKSDITIYIAYN